MEESALHVGPREGGHDALPDQPPVLVRGMSQQTRVLAGAGHLRPRTAAAFNQPHVSFHICFCVPQHPASNTSRGGYPGGAAVRNSRERTTVPPIGAQRYFQPTDVPPMHSCAFSGQVCFQRKAYLQRKIHPHWADIPPKHSVRPMHRCDFNGRLYLHDLM